VNGGSGPSFLSLENQLNDGGGGIHDDSELHPASASSATHPSAVAHDEQRDERRCAEGRAIRC